MTTCIKDTALLTVTLDTTINIPPSKLLLFQTQFFSRDILLLMLMESNNSWKNTVGLKCKLMLLLITWVFKISSWPQISKLPTLNLLTTIVPTQAHQIPVDQTPQIPHQPPPSPKTKFQTGSSNLDKTSESIQTPFKISSWPLIFKEPSQKHQTTTAHTQAHQTKADQTPQIPPQSLPSLKPQFQTGSSNLVMILVLRVLSSLSEHDIC